MCLGIKYQGIADAISYIFNHADAVEKPAVINISIGGHTGPHDGTSLFDQFIDEIVDDGKIVVGAAGNEGSDKLHLDYDFTEEETIYSFVEFPGSDNPNAGSTFIELWVDGENDVELAINLYDIESGEFVDYTDWISSGTEKTYDFTLTDQDATDTDQVSVGISVAKSRTMLCRAKKIIREKSKAFGIVND